MSEVRVKGTESSSEGNLARWSIMESAVIPAKLILVLEEVVQQLTHVFDADAAR